MTSATLLFLLLLCAAVFVWLLRRPRSGDVTPPDADDIDRDTLTRAEEEVRDLDAFLAPEDTDDALPDWGPGAPKS